MSAVAGRPKRFPRSTSIAIKYDASEAECGAMLMTSLPPKRQLSFILDGASYFAVVTLRGREKLVPAAR